MTGEPGNIESLRRGLEQSTSPQETSRLNGEALHSKMKLKHLGMRLAQSIIVASIVPTPPGGDHEPTWLSRDK